MPRDRKHRLLLDENLPPARNFVRLNRRFNLKHVVTNYKKGGITDPEVNNLAIKENRILLTINKKDFIRIPRDNKKSGVIAVSSHLRIDEIDKKLLSLLTKHKVKYFYGKIIIISGQIKR